MWTLKTAMVSFSVIQYQSNAFFSKCQSETEIELINKNCSKFFRILFVPNNFDRRSLNFIQPIFWLAGTGNIVIYAFMRQVQSVTQKSFPTTPSRCTGTPSSPLPRSTSPYSVSPQISGNTQKSIKIIVVLTFLNCHKCGAANRGCGVAKWGIEEQWLGRQRSAKQVPGSIPR